MNRGKIINVLKLLGLLFLFLLWAILIQVEYELIAHPESRDDFPVIKGTYALIFFSFLFLINTLLLIAYRHIFWDAIHLIDLIKENGDVHR